MLSYPGVFDFVRFWVAWKSDDSAISWKIGLLFLLKVLRVVNQVTWNYLLHELCVPNEHFKVMIKSHEILHNVVIVLFQNGVQVNGLVFVK